MNATIEAPKLVGDSNRLRITGVNALGPLEQAIMNYVWDGAKPGWPVTVSDVYMHFRNTNRERAYTTVMTTMNRLNKKGLLDIDDSSITYRYTASKSRRQHERDGVGQAVDALLEIDPEAVLQHVAKILSVGGRR